MSTYGFRNDNISKFQKSCFYLRSPRLCICSRPLTWTILTAQTGSINCGQQRELSPKTQSHGYLNRQTFVCAWTPLFQHLPFCSMGPGDGRGKSRCLKRTEPAQARPSGFLLQPLGNRLYPPHRKVTATEQRGSSTSHQAPA